MKILILSEGKYEYYGDAFMQGFNSLDIEVKHFKWNKYLNSSNILHKIQNKFLIGFKINKINNEIIKESRLYKPDLVFIYRGTHIYSKTIAALKQLGIKVFGYNNDDPFSKKYRIVDFRLWSLYKKSIPYYDWIFSYRLKNIEDYKKIGYNNTSLLRSYYLKENNFYISNIKKEYDVIFIGHWENDGRDKIIKYLIENKINIKLFGTEWESSKYYEFFVSKMGEIVPLFGEDYNKTINEAKIALVFLSKLNNDTYTRRCFEIPATKTMMMSEYTDDLSHNLFLQDKEAIYFKNKEDLLEQIKNYLMDTDKLQNIGKNGHNRLMNDGHEVIDRCKEILKVYNETIN